jgi:hypothetical protein
MDALQTGSAWRAPAFYVLLATLKTSVPGKEAAHDELR